MLHSKLATILLVALSLFELVAALSQCLYSESNKKNGEVGEYPLLVTGYVQVHTYDFHCKMYNSDTFFH
jgi:hypothetical protein